MLFSSFPHSHSFLGSASPQVPVVGLPGQILPTFVRAGLIVYDLATNTARRVLDGKSIVQVCGLQTTAWNHRETALQFVVVSQLLARYFCIHIKLAIIQFPIKRNNFYHNFKLKIVFMIT
jgi:hypothetical protein